MKTPTRAQQLAITTSGNVLVVAGAGTGKTSTLVKRCVSRLIDERCALDRILMVTFTDAAAAEMRHRIGEELQQRRAATDDAGLALHLDQQIALLDTAQISTLSSFCLQLVRDHFYELKLDPQLTVLDDAQTRPLMSRALDAIFESHYAGGSDEDEAARRLIRTYGSGSDAPVRACVIKIHRYTQTLTNPQQWIATQWARYSNEQPEFWSAELCRFFGEWRVFWKSALESWRATVPALDRCLSELDRIECPTAPQLAEVFRCVQASIDDTKAWAGKKTKIPEAKKFIEEMATLNNSVDSLATDWATARPHMLALLKLAQEFSAQFAAAKRELGGVDFADAEQYALELLLGESREQLSPVALSLREQFQHVFVDEYQDINEAQDKIIEAVSRGTSAECGMRNAESVAAPEIPHSVLSTPHLGNRFLVGDVKQSIYRFRLADPKIFGRYHASWKEADAPGRSLPLSDNFRSREAILKFVNGFFATLMQPGVGGVAYSDDAHLVFANANERQPLAQSAEDPRVELHLFSTTSDDVELDTENDGAGSADLVDLGSAEREARLIAQRLKQLHDSGHQIWDRKEGSFRAARWSDMAVLMRSPKTRVETFAKEFHRAGVPLRAARAGFYDAAEVRDFIGLMQLLDNPLQDVPLVAVLRSPLAGLSDDELAEIRIASPHGAFWRAASDFRHRGAPRENENAIRAWQKLNAFMQQLESWRKLIRQSSLSRCLEAVLVDTHYEAMLAADPRGSERMANVLGLIELARAYHPLQRQGLYRFLKFIEAQREMEVDHEPAPVAAGDAVQLMSIHKSKGLEFPVVAIANMGGRFNERSLNDSILLSDPLGLCPKIFPDDLDVMYPSIAHWLARRNERRELWGEEMRLLYVALTRARDTLILVGTAPRRRDGERWESVPSAAISDRALMNGSCYFDWLRLWLQQNTSDQNWTSDRAGASRLVRWNIYASNDAVLATQRFPSIEKAGAAIVDERSANEVLKRVALTYPFTDATHEPAKTSLSALRRRMDADEESFPWFRLIDGTNHSVSGREMGSAHHALLEVIPLEAAVNVESLRAQAVELTEHGVMSEEQAATLDLEAIACFWQSPKGAEIRAQAAHVHRELPFTARFTPKELSAIGLSRYAEPAEFVVLQGVVDLAVLLEEEIWVIDFKTDRVSAADAPAKAEVYRPQLEVYAQALQSVYGKPVTRRWLHFLACGETIEV